MVCDNHPNPLLIDNELGEVQHPYIPLLKDRNPLSFIKLISTVLL